MEYQQAITALDKYLRLAGIKPGLARVNALLKKLGNPEKEIPVIHIAGTNGKGSVTYMTSNALIACDYKVGTFVSPHILKYNERFLFGGEAISNCDFARLFSVVYTAAKKVDGVTEFEILTAMAFLYFKEKKVDVAVMEVGLGGRYDSTNVCKSILTIITPISFDHQDLLGESLRAIAAEKAGIIKKGVPVVVAEQEPEVLAVIMAVAEKLENEIKVVTHPIKQKLALLGDYQRYNAALVIEGLQLLMKYNIYIPRRLMLNGIAKTVIPGRTEVFSENPLTILDVAHNPQGIKNTIKVVRSNYQFKKKVFILGMLKRKDLVAALKTIDFFVDEIIAVNLKTREAYKAADILKIAAECGIRNIVAKENVAEAYQAAVKSAGSKGLIIIAGSFYLISEFYKNVKKTKSKTA